MIGAAGADPGRSDVHSHIHWIWEDSRHTRMEDKCCAVGYMECRNTGVGRRQEVTLQKAVAIRNGIALDKRIRKWLARVISNLPP